MCKNQQRTWTNIFMNTAAFLFHLWHTRFDFEVTSINVSLYVTILEVSVTLVSSHVLVYYIIILHFLSCLFNSLYMSRVFNNLSSEEKSKIHHVFKNNVLTRLMQMSTIREHFQNNPPLFIWQNNSQIMATIGTTQSPTDN